MAGQWNRTPRIYGTANISDCCRLRCKELFGVSIQANFRLCIKGLLRGMHIQRPFWAKPFQEKMIDLSKHQDCRRHIALIEVRVTQHLLPAKSPEPVAVSTQCHFLLHVTRLLDIPRSCWQTNRQSRPIKPTWNLQRGSWPIMPRLLPRLYPASKSALSTARSGAWTTGNAPNNLVESNTLASQLLLSQEPEVKRLKVRYAQASKDLRLQGIA